MRKHRKGPWEYRKGGIVVAATGDGINHLQDDATVNANFTLQAAAPELLEALRNLFFQMKTMSPAAWDLNKHKMLMDLALLDAQAAIAKATGE